MKAAPMIQKPSFPLMKQGDIQSIYHLQMPRWLFTDERYMPLSLEAKVAYTFLLNRFQLSRLNGWVNDDGEVFIIYTRRSLAAEMQVSYRKVIESMKELSGAGLIWERRCGRGDANQIYLARVDQPSPGKGCAPFVEPDHEAAGGTPQVDAGSDRPAGPEHAEKGEDRSAAGSEQEDSAEDSPLIRSAGSELLDLPAPSDGAALPRQEVQDRDFMKCGAETSRDTPPESLEVRKPHPNYTDWNLTDRSHTEVSPSVSRSACGTPYGTDRQAMEERRQLAEILEQCELWIFDPETAKVLENAVERLFYSESFRIGKAVLPQANVRSRLWDLDGVILQTAVGKLHSNQCNVKNSTAYTMAVIFNAICESQSDLMVDPYLNSLRDGPGSGDRGGGSGCF